MSFLQNYRTINIHKVHDLSFWLVNNKFLFRRLKILILTFPFIKERDLFTNKEHHKFFQFNLIYNV
jgi:hypothetical protein